MDKSIQGVKQDETPTKHLAHLQAFIEMAEERRKANNRDISSCLIIYASGAIGAKANSMKIVRGHLKDLIQANNNLCDTETSSHYPGWLVTPPFLSKSRVKYQITEFEHIINSSEASLETAKKIGRLIKQKYNEYDSFIVLVGLDTSCYIASLVSFMFQNLNKMVYGCTTQILFTGATIPLCYMRNDAFNNLLDSLAVVAEFLIYEVVILNKFQVFRANRTSKVYEGRFQSIMSPNFPVLIDIKIDFSIREKYFLPKPNKDMEYFDDFCTDIKVLKYHPLLTTKTLEYELADPTVKAIVVESYSSANIPIKKQILQLFHKATKHTIIVNISQCTFYTHNSIASRKLAQYDIIYGGNMTTEACLAKLAFLLGKHATKQQIKQAMKTDLRGQLSEQLIQSEVFQRPAQSFMQILEQVLPRRVQKNKSLIENAILPAVIRQVIRNGNTDTLQDYLKMYGQLSEEYLEVEKILHIAVKANNIAIVEHLLHFCIDLNDVDQEGCSAMFYALRNMNKKMCYLLMTAGGRVISPDWRLTQLFVGKIKQDSKEFLELAYFAGLKKPILQSIVDDEKRSIGHYCAIFKAKKCIDFLKAKEVKYNLNMVDIYGMKPSDMTKQDLF